MAFPRISGDFEYKMVWWLVKFHEIRTRTPKDPGQPMKHANEETKWTVGTDFCRKPPDHRVNRERQFTTPRDPIPSTAAAAAHVLHIQPPGTISQQLPPTTAADLASGASNNSLSQLGEPTKTLVSEALGACAMYTKRSRHLVRIQAAAKELGLRIAEYEEWLRTPEGRMEELRAQAQVEVQQRQALSFDARVDAEGSVDSTSKANDDDSNKTAVDSDVSFQ